MTVLKLTRYELKKLFVKKSFLLIIAFMILLAFGAYLRPYLTNYKYNFSGIEGPSDLYSVYGGELTEEKLNTLNSLYNYASEINASGVYDLTYNPDKYFGGYQAIEVSAILQMCENAERVMAYEDYIKSVKEQTNEFIAENPNLDEYMKKYNQMIADTFGDRKLNSISYYDGFLGYDGYFEYKFSNILILLIVVVGVMTIFTTDTACGCKDYLATALHGSKITVTSKLIACAVFMLITMAVFFSADFIYFMTFERLDGFYQPLYYLPDFKDTAINITIWQYLILTFAIRFMGFMTIALITALVSHITQKPIISFFITFLSFFGFMFARYLIVAEHLSLLNCFNPVSLLMCHDMFRGFNVTNFFGTPLHTYIVTLVGVGLINLILLVLLFISEGVIAKKGRVKNA